MLLGAVWLVVANAAACLGAWAIVRRLRKDPTPFDLLLFLLLRLVLVSSVVLAFGSLGILTANILGAGGAIALAGLMALGEHRSLPRLDLSRLPRWAWVGIALLIARLLAQIWFFAPYTTDVLSYHLPKVAEWIRTGSLFGERGIDDHATFPAGFELVEAWWVVFLHHDVLIEMAGVEFLLLAYSAAGALARGLGLAPGRARAAGLLYVLGPGLYFQATSGLNDGAVAACLVCSAALLLARCPAPLLLASIGLGAGIKPTFLFALPGLFLLRLVEADTSGLQTWNSPRIRFAIAFLGLALGAWWYAQNSVLYGNPVHPVGQKPMPVQFGPRMSTLARNVFDLFQNRIWDAQAPYGAHLDRSAGWGATAVGAGLLSLVLLIRTDRRFRNASLAFATGAAGVLLFVVHDDWYGRFVLFIPALLAIALVRVMELYPRILWIVIVAGASQVAGTFLPYDIQPKTLRLLVAQDWRHRSTAPTFSADVEAGVVGYLAANRGPAYVLYRPDFSRRVVYLRATTAASLQREILDEGVEAIFAASLAEDQTRAVNDLAKSGLLKEERPRILRVVGSNTLDGFRENR